MAHLAAIPVLPEKSGSRHQPCCESANRWIGGWGSRSFRVGELAPSGIKKQVIHPETLVMRTNYQCIAMIDVRFMQLCDAGTGQLGD